MTLQSDHRKALTDLTAISTAEVNGVVRRIADLPLREFAGGLRDAMPRIADQLTPLAEVIAVDYYDATRIQVGLGLETYRAATIDYDGSKTLDSGIGYSVARLVGGSDLGSVIGILAGTLQKVITDADRETVADNSNRDPDVTKYVRVPQGDSCAFCLTMAAVAEVEVSADFDKYHSFCRCTTTPVYRGQETPRLPIYDEIQRQYADARSEIEVNRQLANYYQTPRKQRPKELALTTPNILKIVREVTGLR